MKIKNKLSYGMGALFGMILFLGLVSVGYIVKISADTQSIYDNNNNSLDYARNMLTALETIGTDDAARAIFQENLERQKRNITEDDEKDVTRKLELHYTEYIQTGSSLLLQKIRTDLYHIMSLNMNSVHLKQKMIGDMVHSALLWISVAALLCLVVAAIMFFRFPKSIVEPIKRLTNGILEISQGNYQKRLPVNSNDEFKMVSHSFNKMAESLEEFKAGSLEDILSAKKYIEAIVNSITEPIIGLDKEKRIVFINNEALNILNLKREEVLGKLAAEISLRNDLLRRLIKELLNRDTKKEPLKIYADNKESYFKAFYIPIIIRGEDKEQENRGDVILLRNITEFKELDAAKTTFISTISHELKTPVSAIMMSLQLLEDKRIGELNGEQHQLSESIKENSERLIKIIGELLNMTQVEAGRLQLMPKVTKPIELIDYAINANRVQADKFNCHIEVDYPEKISKLFVDSEKIAWVITNLLSNAIRYSSENGRVVIGARQLDSNEVEIFVKDFGKGIDPRYHESIFDRYFRVPGTKVQGSGLGLSISRDFVEAHNGKLTVESELGKGSCCLLYTSPSPRDS